MRTRATRALGSLLVTCASSTACVRDAPPDARPQVELVRLPVAAEGGTERMAPIAGRVTGARPGQRVVLYARSGPWWVQPLQDQPFTQVRADGTFENTTHLGVEYAALLVEPGYRPPPRVDQLPEAGAGVAAVAVAKGVPPAVPQRIHTLRFSGYEWRVRDAPSERGGWSNRYDPANAWTDEAGALHLRIARSGEGWSCAEVILTRSLGYGTYSFTVRGVEHLPPSVVMGLFTWDDVAGAERFREMSIEASRWGDPANANLQYVIQPYFVPANVRRFQGPAGPLTHTLRWELDRATFGTLRGRGRGSVVAGHVFTSGVPLPGNETVRMNLYVFGDPARAVAEPTEVVVESFEYAP